MLIFILYSLLLAQFAHAGLFNSPAPPAPSVSQYTINDIMDRYRNLSAQNREVSYFSTHAEADSSCVRSALEPILAECLKTSVNDIDPNMRVMTAAKLSVCEFQAVRIEYPVECQSQVSYFGFDSSVDYDKCAAAMEEKTQWWATFTGYYQSIGEMCLQESLPYEKDEIWKMFIEVTEHYQQVFDSLMEYVDLSEKLKKSSEDSFVVMHEFMEQMRNHSEGENSKMDLMWEYISGQMEKVSKMSLDVTELTRQQADSLESSIMAFFSTVDVQFSQELDSLRDRFIADLELRDQLMSSSLNITRDRLSALHHLSAENANLSSQLSTNLRSTVDTAHHLNSSLSQMDESLDSLTGEIKDATELMTSMSGVLKNNVLVRALLFVSQDFAMEAETILVIGTLTFVSFFVCVMISWRINVFKYVGIFVVSLALGCVIGTVVMLVGKVVNEEVERQLQERIVNMTTTSANSTAQSQHNYK